VLAKHRYLGLRFAGFAAGFCLAMLPSFSLEALFVVVRLKFTGGLLEFTDLSLFRCH
jgi:hypothetical protein